MITNITLNKLNAWDQNPRVTSDENHISELKASILENGLLQNLIAVPDHENDGNYLVIAGASRLEALKALAAEGKIYPETYSVSVETRDLDLNDADALMIALSENVVRRQMDAIDECIAMANLAHKGKTENDIAVAFGYSKRLIRQRLALGRLVPEAQMLIREKIRDLDFARALTLADASTQNKIVQDVRMNNASWKDGNEIRRFLTQETIPSSHAIFQVKDYKGRIIHDMFDGDKLTDRAEFWELQNKAIEELKSEIEKEGWESVEVSTNPVDLWRYKTTEEVSEGKVIIEVSPNGKVTTHRGLVDPVEVTSVDGEDSSLDFSLDNDDVEEDHDLHGDAVRTTPALSEYAAAHRSAMIQSKVANDFRLSLEITVAGLIGHGEIAIRAQEYRFPGNLETRNGADFEAVEKNREFIDEQLQSGAVPVTGRTDKMVMTFVKSLGDDELQALFTKLVASKIGQNNSKRLDSNEDSLFNDLGSRTAIDVRSLWTPDETFFNMMQASDLRRIATALLPADRQSGVLSAKKNNLVIMLTSAFEDAAANDGSMDASNAERLNTWIPGMMMFPAQDDADRCLETADDHHTEENVFDALFDSNEEEETVENKIFEDV